MNVAPGLTPRNCDVSNTCDMNMTGGIYKIKTSRPKPTTMGTGRKKISKKGEKGKFF